MNIVIANKYYFYTGGPERYMAAVTQLLQRNGHTVIPFAMKLDQNEPSEYRDYFVSPPAKSNQYKLDQFNLSLYQKVSLLGRAIYSWGARQKLTALIRDAQVDLVYLLNICNYLSPSLIDAAKRCGVPVVMRLSDYNFACASYRFLREDQVCTECLDSGSFRPALRYRCVQNSLVQTAGRVIPMTIHRLLNILGKVDAFVAPSPTMADALVQFGCEAQRVYHVPSFVDLEQFEPVANPRRDYVLYLGRLDPDKGVDVLLAAWARLGAAAPLLCLAGTGTAVLELQAQAQAAGLTGEKVRFLGQLDKVALLETLQHAAFTVTPSLWMDNSPMSVYESLACGKPVVASDIGGIKSQIVHGQTGFLFTAGDREALAVYVERLWTDRQLVAQMSEQARETAVTHFSPEVHWHKLGNIFRQAKGIT